jgi:predicted outer membrane repeat protein
MAGKSGIGKWVLVFALAAAAPAGALTVPFTEDFTAGASNWLNATSGPLTFNATGGPDGGSYVSTTAASINNPGTIQFRGNLSANASGGAFAGNWAGGAVTLVSADVIHDAPTDLTFFFRISAGPAFVGVVPTPVQPKVWTHITLAIDPSNPLLIPEGPVSFNTVFGNVLNLQLGVAAPIGHEGVPFTYGLDKVAVVPEPATAGLLALGLLALSCGRRRS